MTFTSSEIKGNIKAVRMSLGEKRIASLKEANATYVIYHPHPECKLIYVRTHEYKTLNGALKAAYVNGWEWAELESCTVVNGEKVITHLAVLY